MTSRKRKTHDYLRVSRVLVQIKNLEIFGNGFFGIQYLKKKTSPLMYLRIMNALFGISFVTFKTWTDKQIFQKLKRDTCAKFVV